MLYLIRHTAPDIAPGICYGQLDMGLKDSFDTEANTVMRLLPPFDLIITSPLLRCRKLAEHLARAHHCTMQTDARLMEKHFGLWEGRDWRDIARCEIDAWAADIMGYAPEGGESAQQLMLRVQDFMGDLAKRPNQHGASSAPEHKSACAGRFPHPNPDGTTSHSTKLPKDGSQVAGYLPEGEGTNESLRDFHENQNIALITHGGTLRAMLAQLAAIPLTDTLNWQIDYGAVTGVNVSSFI